MSEPAAAPPSGDAATKPAVTGSSRGEDSYDHLVPMLTEHAGLPADDPRREVLRDRLVQGYLPLARHIARRFAQRGEPQEDLEQVATVGLIHAVDRFSPERGSDFLSYAVPTITGEVRRYFRDKAWSTRVPRRLKDLRLAIGSAMPHLSQELNRAPTAGELAEHLQRTREEVLEALEAANAYRSSSLDDMLVDDPSSGRLADVLGSADAELEQVEHRETVQPALRKLPERERTIVMLRFFGGMTQTQIAERVGVSQMHVSRLLTRTLATLRADLSDPPTP
ncbi:SigB/SigF/SigG family RNA polymerase sigma factor [Actinomycetospora chlora]|uniref:SigB/SigF/SigG family RNA polymerase sigma factor n=2 Tax=Actinomycetospora chlora TaxID=663608 RepID=A0ABP9ARM6_9PSEU